MVRMILAAWIVMMSAGIVLADAEADRLVRRELDRFEQQLQAGQGQQAMQTFMALKAKHPDHVDVRAHEGRILLLQNNQAGAEAAFKAALEMEPHHPLASAMMANIEFRTFKVNEAQARVTAALEKHPDAWELLQISGEMFTAQQKLDEALPMFEKIIANKANPPRAIGPAHAHLGAALLKQGKAGQAAEHLGKSLAIHWELQVALVHVQALDQADAPIADLRKAVEDLRKRLAAASNHPQIAQIRQQVDQQLASADRKLREAAANDRSAQALVDLDKKLADLDAELAKQGKEFNAFTAGRYAREARTLANRITDATAKEEKLQAIGLRDMRLAVRNVRQGIESNAGTSVMKYRADQLEKAIEGQPGPEAEEATRLVAQVRQDAGKLIQQQVEKALGLAREGWSFDMFDRGSTEQREKLKELELPERYDQFPPEVKAALKAHYEPLAAKRPDVPLEKAVETYLQTPGDAAARAKVVELAIQSLGQIKAIDQETSIERIIPARIWVEQPSHRRSPNLESKVSDKRELAWSINDRNSTSRPRRNHQWQAVIEATSRVIEPVYPRHHVLADRAEAHLLLGQYQQAYEDTLLAMAVLAWEHANSVVAQRADSTDGRLGRRYIIQAKVIGELAANKPSRRKAYASEPLARFLEDARQNRWENTLDYILAEHPEDSLDAMLVRNIRYDTYGHWRNKVIDAAAAQHPKADATRKAKLVETIGGWVYSHPTFALMRYQAATDPKEKESHLFAAVNNNYRDAQAYFELGKYYEAQNDKPQAMLAYNTAAGGELASKLTGIRRQAADARDRLEGPTPDFQAVYRVYKPHYEDLMQKTQQGAPLREAAFYEAVVNRLISRNASRASVIGSRADARRQLKDYQGAIDDLEELIRLGSKAAPLAWAVIGNNQMDLGQYAQAVEAYTKAVEGGNMEPWVYYNRSLNLGRLGRYDDMLADLNIVIEKNDKYALAYDQRSKYYEYILGDDGKALPDAKKALELYKEENPDGRYFELTLRISNLEMKIAQDNLNRLLGG